MNTTQKTLKDFIDLYFILKPVYKIDDAEIIALMEDRIVTIENSIVKDTLPYRYKELVPTFLKIIDDQNDVSKLEKEYNFKLKYVNNTRILINNKYIGSLKTKQVTTTIEYMKFPNDQEVYFGVYEN